MKKIAALLGLIISTPSVFCMEKDNEFTDIPLTDFHPTKLYPTYTINRMSQPKKQVKEQEKKTLLKTSSFAHPDLDVMRQLYTDGENFIHVYEANFHSQHLNRWEIANSHSLNTLFINIDKAQAKNITLDSMMQFTLQQPRSRLLIDNNPTTCIFFGCLKHYKNTKEANPFAPIKKPSQDLAEYLGIKNTIIHSNKEVSVHPTITYSHLSQFPAYLKLVDSLMLLFSYCPEIREDLVSFLCSNKKIVHKNSYPTTSINFKNEFYHEAYNVITTKKIDCDSVYRLLDMIESAKLARDINNEEDIGKGILNFEPTKDLFNWDEHYTHFRTKCIISILCGLLASHNTANKITTTKEQYLAYKLQKNLSIAFPDSYTNDVFDDEKYALKKFDGLIDNIYRLKRLNNEAHDEEMIQYASGLYGFINIPIQQKK